MIELSTDAKKELDSYFDGKEKGTIRIFLAPGGCSGPALRLALDEAGPDDVVEQVDGYDFCTNKELQEQVGGCKITVSPMGFVITPEHPLPDTGGGCGGCCGGCGGN